MGCPKFWAPLLEGCDAVLVSPVSPSAVERKGGTRTRMWLARAPAGCGVGQFAAISWPVAGTAWRRPSGGWLAGRLLVRGCYAGRRGGQSPMQAPLRQVQCGNHCDCQCKTMLITTAMEQSLKR